VRNRGDWTFHDISDRSEGLDALATMAAMATDFEEDGDLDFWLLDRTGTLVFLENLRSGRFVAQPLEAEVFEVDQPHSLAAYDHDNSGKLKFLVGHGSGATVETATRWPARQFSRLGRSIWTTTVGWTSGSGAPGRNVACGSFAMWEANALRSFLCPPPGAEFVRWTSRTSMPMAIWIFSSRAPRA
jgi:hypothetical protein